MRQSSRLTHARVKIRCQGKTLPDSDQYIRIAGRTQTENRELVAAFVDIIDSKKTNSRGFCGNAFGQNKNRLKNEVDRNKKAILKEIKAA